MKKIIIMLLVLIFSASLLQAEERAEAKMSFWEIIRSKIEKVTPQKKPAVTTAVGGVRGAKSDNSKSLYWKGETVTVAVSEQELDSFKAALVKAEMGDLVQGRELFQRFVADYPKSVLKDDALIALQEMRTGQDQPAVETPPATEKL